MVIETSYISSEERKRITEECGEYLIPVFSRTIRIRQKQVVEFGLRDRLTVIEGDIVITNNLHTLFVN